MKLGCDQLPLSSLADGRRVGLLVHSASRTRQGISLVDHLVNAGVAISALFGPEHGVETIAHDMEPVGNGRVALGGRDVPVYSLYGDTVASLSPTREMLRDCDVVIIDLQDIGTRYYTYIYTMALMMTACADAKIPVIVCDRPNPINGVTIGGPMLEQAFASFVGMYRLPVRHAMTIGELAHFFNAEFEIGCSLEVVRMEGWRREMHWDETELTWVNPSPNMRSLHAALLYPGMCLLEATNVSEGRGHETPFEVMGAPWIDRHALREMMESCHLPGVRYEEVSFTPRRQKYEGVECHGLRFVITERDDLMPFRTGVALVWAIHRLFSESGFVWRQEPYEFVDHIPAFDLLTGSDTLRMAIESGASIEKINHLIGGRDPGFVSTRRKYLLY